MSAGHAYRIERIRYDGARRRSDGVVGRYPTASAALTELRSLLKPKKKGAKGGNEFDLYQGDVKVLTVDRHGRDRGAWA